MAQQVMIGCKLATGLIIGIGGKQVTLNGANSNRIIGGYGLTRVDKELADAWFEAYKDFDPVIAGLIFVQDKKADAEAQAKEQTDVKTGTENLDPKNPAPGIEAKKDN